MFKKLSQKNSGQSLIETMVAIFILVMGITSAVGLASFSLNNSTSIAKQIVATGLAREGVEAVKNMRDTNWLQQTTIDPNCYNFETAGNTGNCYKNWLTQKYCIDPTDNNGNCAGTATTQNYFLGFDYSDNNFWYLVRQRNADNYGLVFNSTPTQYGMYWPGDKTNGTLCSDGTAGISDFCRKVIITKINTSPYNKANQTDIGPKLLVQVQVWWKDRKCARSANWPGAGKCAIELSTYLTNWKNY